jgi:hypothetical protein
LISSREGDIDGERQRESRKTELSKRKIDYEARVLVYLLRTTCYPNWISSSFSRSNTFFYFCRKNKGAWVRDTYPSVISNTFKKRQHLFELVR